MNVCLCLCSVDRCCEYMCRFSMSIAVYSKLLLPPCHTRAHAALTVYEAEAGGRTILDICISGSEKALMPVCKRAPD